jgi:NAD(P)-dependent dehydrogenase (short-subunit alcohol dehydrogenase family)
MIDFNGKVAVVVGGSSGIGAATVRRLAEHGASVMIGDVAAVSAHALATTLRPAGYQIEVCRTDVLIEADIVALMAATVDRFGRIDILVNSAGIPRTIAPDCEVINMPLDWWNKTIAGHLTSTMLASKYALPHLIAAGGGAIVNVSSAACSSATLDLPAYSASKAGVIQLTREVAATYGRDNVRCNAVIPGLVLTARGRATMTPETFEVFATETPLPRLAEAEDLANVIAFLCSDAASMVTGQALPVDGGMMIKLPYWGAKMRASRGARFDATTAKAS